MDKLLYTVGNLYTGYPYGVEAERDFGTTDLYGPFTGENEANTFAHKLVEDANPLGVEHRYASVKVVRIETPQAGKRIVRSQGGGYEYAV